MLSHLTRVDYFSSPVNTLQERQVNVLDWKSEIEINRKKGILILLEGTFEYFVAAAVNAIELNDLEDILELFGLVGLLRFSLRFEPFRLFEILDPFFVSRCF